jgi:hypothetical protein
MIHRVREMIRRLTRELIGQRLQLPAEDVAAHPVLGEGRWRVGGLPLRIGGWFLGQKTVAGITLGSTVFLAESTAPSVRLLLHEMGHVKQFQRDKSFPMRYLWESLHRGYAHNQYEAEADQFVEEIVWSSTPRRPS